MNQHEGGGRVIPFPASGAPLPSGGGGGTYDDMEARVARLEAGIGHLERDVGELRADMKDVREKLIRVEERMATTKGMFLAAGAIIAAIAAFTTFQENIRALLGLIAPN